ncbi:FAD binding domain [Fusarium albosuccineum]|uniref:FAD binding domain n=1 Tax=Fusarium albosuccineum TaxID=1237068 RepID=A0A8H4LR17_9HYPO|nr:FAD binding domain [Fusarium albosuccineum]
MSPLHPVALALALHAAAGRSIKITASYFSKFVLAKSYSNQSVKDICSALETDFPALTIFPGESLYNYINEGEIDSADAVSDYFSAEDWLGPACIFTPTSSELMAHAVVQLERSGAPFAVRGGGWMPVAGAANINSSGILLATTNLTDLQLTSDLSSVSVAAGLNWADVLDYLAPYDLVVVGSRIGVVGVPGFLLGGGMSFLSNQYGWASANVVGYEAILADVSIVHATADNQYSDLFWALRAGGNDFAIVTKFELKTLNIPSVAVGQVAYGPGQRDPFIRNLYDFSQAGVLDQRAFVLPTISYVPAAGPNITYSAILFYNDNNTSPSALENFLPPVASPLSSTFSLRTMANWTAEADEGFDQVHGQNFRFHGFSMLADLDAIPRRRPDGLDADRAPYFFCEETFSWSWKNETKLIDQLMEDINVELRAKLGDIIVPFLYLNNAGGGQDVFQGYNPANVARLRSMKEKYDESGLLTNQLVGGFKLH